MSQEVPIIITRAASEPTVEETVKIELHNLAWAMYRHYIDDLDSEGAAQAVQDIGRLRRELQAAGFVFKTDRTAIEDNARKGLEAAKEVYRLAIEQGNSELASYASEHRAKFKDILKEGKVK